MFELLCNILLFVFLGFTYFTPVEEAKVPKSYAAFFKNSLAFFKSRMFIGMVILVVASFILEPLGFVVTSALLMFSYGLLLGEKKWLRLAIISCVLGVGLHIAFSGLLGVNLPRGTVPFLRSFSLFLENLF